MQDVDVMLEPLRAYLVLAEQLAAERALAPAYNIGPDGAAESGGHGLANMRTRFVSMGGDFAIAAVDGGTRITATLPLGRIGMAPPRGQPRLASA